MLLFVDDHAAHLANCASADDDSLPLMSAELLPRLEGGIRAALEEVDNMFCFLYFRITSYRCMLVITLLLHMLYVI